MGRREPAWRRLQIPINMVITPVKLQGCMPGAPRLPRRGSAVVPVSHYDTLAMFDSVTTGMYTANVLSVRTESSERVGKTLGVLT